ncbi:MAG: DCL family protein [Ignavibacteriae bacterium]|nr:DCL family protein [Ignavibacteriota bacterium]
MGFNTKTDSYRYSKNIIDKIGNEIGKNEKQFVFKTHKDYNFLNDLIKNHIRYDDKIGCGIDFFIIRKNFAGANELNIQREDGSIESISWSSCAKINTKHNDKNHLTAAMREAINLTCYEFKKKQEDKSCRFCGDDNDIHTDHHNPSFIELQNRFLKENTKIPTKYSKRVGTHKVCFLEEDWDFEKKWKSYHDDNCSLQLLCRSCNLKKSKK